MTTFPTVRNATQHLAAILGAALISLPAAAQNMKPSMWEVQNRMGGEQGA